MNLAAGSIYKAFGLNIRSVIELPECTAAADYESIDITVEINNLQSLWSQLASPNESFVIRENMVMFEVPNVAIYLIQNGNQITISSLPGFDEDAIRLYLLGTCMGAIMMQRKVLPLHGSAVVINGNAYAFVGDSGAGKSTLAAAFLSQGYHLLSDDVIPVTIVPDGTPYVIPAYPQQKLWLESLIEFGLEPNAYRPVIGSAAKYAVPFPSQFAAKPIKLAGVFELVKTEREQIDLIRMPRLEQMLTLFRHTYRNFLISPSGLMQWHFHTTASILNVMDVCQLRRPDARFTAHDLASLVVHAIENDNNARDNTSLYISRKETKI